jgi:membrane protease YdiL (CAAX protease family)
LQVQLGLSEASAWIVQGIARQLLVVLAILCTVLFWERKPLTSIGVRRLRTPDLALAVVAYVLMILSVRLVTEILNFSPLRQVLPTLNPAAQAYLELPLGFRLTGAAVNSIYEETWRAFAIERVESISGSLTAAATFSLIASVSTHVPFWGLRGALVIAPGQLVLIFLYLGRRSLPTCVITHFIADAYPTAIRPALSSHAIAMLSKFGL